jgi:hypothetical protein
MAKNLPFERPAPGLAPTERPKDRLAQFIEVRRAFYHCKDLMKELEGAHDVEMVAPIFARAARRLALAAGEFSEGQAGE